MRPTEEQRRLMSLMRAAALKATQLSPWSVAEDDHGRCVVLDADDTWVADCGNAPADATHIALACPANVMVLLEIIGGLIRQCDHNEAEIRRLDVALAKLRKQQGRHPCQVCGHGSVVPVGDVCVCHDCAGAIANGAQ